VRGRACHGIQNHLKHALDIGQHIIVPETQHAVTHGLQILGPMLVVIRLLRMLTTIQLNNQHGLRTDEIDDVTAYFVLPSELPSRQVAVAQVSPQQLFHIRHRTTQSARAIHIVAFHP
jgi:hypothetical protein